MSRGGMLGDVGRSIVRTVLRGVGRTASQVQEAKPLPVDVMEGEEEYLVVFDAPGAEGADVQVRYVDGEVRVRVDRFRPLREDFEMVVPGRGLTLEGRAELPPEAVVDADAASATLTPTGSLRVRLPKGETDEE